MTRIADLRPDIRTLEDAKKIMANISNRACEIAFSKAKQDKQIQAAKERHSDRIEDAAKELKDLTEQLQNFIVNNKHLFVKPRKVVTEFGNFGLQKVKEVQINDEELCIKDLLEKGYNTCYQTIHKPEKKAIRVLLEAGAKIPGCQLHDGDTAVLTLSKTLIDEAKERGEQ